MAGEAPLEVRPRTTGEILDEAWRLALADAPPLLALSSLFLLPAGAALLWLWTEPRPGGFLARLALPALTAVLLPLTGLGSGACQELFRRRAEGSAAGLAACLGAALRHGLDHAVARALLLLAAAPGLVLLLLAGLVVWRHAGAGFLLILIPATLFCLGLALGVNSALHPAIAGGEVHAFSAFRLSGQEAQRQAGKATAVALGRLALWIFAFLNLHVAINLVFGIADTVGGFDVALLELVLSLSNPAYCIALLFMMLVLAAPVVEATNYLLHIDARTRYEGLDLWYRVRRLFPRGEWRRAGSILLGLGTLLVASSQARAEDNRLATVRAARQEVGTIIQEIAAAEPYPGSERWLPRLRAVADRLNRGGSTRPRSFRWFEKAVAGLPRRNRERALEILKELDGRLALIEQTLTSDETSSSAGPRRSKEEIEALLPSQNSEAEAREAERERAHRDKTKERVRRDDRDQDGPERGEGQGTGIMVPVLGGFRLIGWLLLGGLLVAVLVVAIVLWLQHRGPGRQRKAVKSVAALSDLDSTTPRPDQSSAEELWRQADESARAGRFLEAVRAVYLGVLALLHRANLIRYERTRTNGEYLNQLRPHAGLEDPFRNLTSIFEIKFYGERSCQPDDYSACRAIAQNILGNVRSGPTE